MKRLIPLILLCCWLVPLLEMSFAQADQQTYQQGMRAYSKKQFQKAINLFNQAMTQQDSNHDAMLFWTASSQFKLDDYQKALNTLKTLFSDFPKSRWLEDAEALQAEIQAVSGLKPDEESLQGLSAETVLVFLTHMPAGEALPLIESLMERQGYDRIKEQALFALTQIKGKQARQLLQQYAEDESSRFSHNAIQYLALSGEPQNLAYLKKRFQQTQNQNLKAELLSAFMLANDVDMLVDIARGSENKQLAIQAQNLLGAMGNKDALVMLYQEATSTEDKIHLLDGLAIAGEREFLNQALAEATEPELKHRIIRALGLAQDCESIERAYENAETEAMRKACLDALMIAAQCDLVVQFLQTETVPQHRATLILKLAHQGDTHIQTLLDLYQHPATKVEKEAVLQALFIAQRVNELIDLAEAENNSALKNKAIQLIGLTQTPEALEYLKKKINP